MTATIDPTTATTPTTTTDVAGSLRTRLASRPLWLVSVGAVAAGAVATMLFSAVARAIDIPLAVSNSEDTAAEVIPAWGFGFAVTLSGVLGVLFALACARWAKRPARTFTVTAIVFTVLSFGSPLTAQNATTATRVALEVGHVVAAAVIIPLIAARMPRTRTRPAA
jgi:Na+/melibiose symporter-like transporter